MSAKQAVRLGLTEKEIDALSDALSYYEMVSQGNFGMGYSGEEGREERAKHKRVGRLLDRVVKIQEARW